MQTPRNKPGGAPPPSPSRMPPKEEKSWLTRDIRIRKGHLLLILLVVIVCIIVIAVKDAGVRRMEAELTQARAEVGAALDEVAEKETLLRFSQTDDYIEQEARSRFGFIRPDEIRILPVEGLMEADVIVLPTPTATPAPTDALTGKVIESTPTDEPPQQEE